MRVVGESAFRAEQAASRPRAFYPWGGEVEIVVLLPTGQVRIEQVIYALLFEHGRGFSGTLDVGHFGFHGMVIIAQAVDGAVVDEQVAPAVAVLERAHVPTLDGFPLVKQRALQLVVPVDGLACGITDIRVFVSHVVGVHEHDVLPGLGAFHDLDTLAHAVGTEDAVRLHPQDHVLEFPVDQVIGRVAGKAREGIALVRLPFAEQVITPVLFHDAGTMGVDDAAPVVEPRDAVDYHRARTLAETGCFGILDGLWVNMPDVF